MATQIVTANLEPLLPSWLSMPLQSLFGSVFNLPPRISEEFPSQLNPPSALQPFVSLINRLPIALQPSESVSLINRLPIDLLTRIFSSEYMRPATPEELFQEKPPTHPSFAEEYKNCPLLLGQVCQRWNAITLGNPVLWASLRILSKLENPKHNNRVLAMWLARSKDAPLTIRFMETFEDLTPKDPWFIPAPNPNTADMMALLCAQAHRWKTVDFEFAFQIPRILCSMRPGSFTILKSARLRSRREPNNRFYGDEQTVNVWRALHASPSFHKGDYEMEAVLHNMRETPWARLTSVHLTICMDDLLIKILPFCQHLVELHYTDPLTVYSARRMPVKRLTPDEDEDPDSEPLKNVTLRTLRHFSFIAAASPDKVFQYLTLPRLESFSFVQTKMREVSDSLPLTDLLMRSQCKLKKFSYQALTTKSIEDYGDFQSRTADDVLYNILTSPTMSHVVDLTVIANVTNDLATALNMTDQAFGIILPALRSFSLARSVMRPGELGKMVSALKRNHGNFKSFTAECWSRHEEDRRIFAGLREQGMIIDD